MLSEVRTKPREIPRRKAPGPFCALVADSLESYDGRWPDGDCHAATPAPSYAWLSAARTAFSEAAEVRVLGTEQDGNILAATALVATGCGPLWRWQPPGSELGEPTDVAARDPRALAHLVKALVGLGQVVEFSRMPADSPALGAVRRGARGRAMVSVHRAEAERFLELDESWVRPESKLSPPARHKLEAARREAECQGGISVEICTPDLCGLPRLLDGVFACETAQGVADDASRARRMSEDVFYRRYCELACATGSLRIAVLRIGDRIAAATIAVEQEAAIWLLKIACSPRFESCSTGPLLVCALLRYAAESDMTRCFLWGEPHPWLSAWPTATRACVGLRIYPLGPIGVGLAAVDSLRRLGQTMLKFLRG